MKQKNKIFINVIALLIAMLGASFAKAHIVLENQTAEVGSYYKAIFKVGHGCENSPITKISVAIPEGFQAAKPMVKPGWHVMVNKSKLSKPYISHGKTVSEDTVEIVWDGNVLTNGFYDEFILVGKLPDQVGKLYWKVTQVCEKGLIEWTEIPVAGQKMKDLRFPAAELDVIKSKSSDHHHGH